MTAQFQQAAPLLEIMAGDPSLRGLTGALETGLTGIRRGQLQLDSAAGTFNTVAGTIEDVLKNGKGVSPGAVSSATSRSPIPTSGHLSR